MSEQFNHPAADRPRTERWVVIMGLAFVPMIIALFVPQSIRVPLGIVAIATFVVGFVLMVRQSRHPSVSEGLRRMTRSHSE